jgi:hypothetical protein
LKCKNKHVLIKKFNTTSNEKNYDHPTFKQYKKTTINLFSLYCMEKHYMREKKKKLKALGLAPSRTQLNIFSLGVAAQPDPRALVHDVGPIKLGS